MLEAVFVLVSRIIFVVIANQIFLAKIGILTNIKNLVNLFQTTILL